MRKGVRRCKVHGSVAKFLDHVVHLNCGAVIPGMGSSRVRTQDYVKVLRHPRYDDRVMWRDYGAILSHLVIPM